MTAKAISSARAAIRQLSNPLKQFVAPYALGKTPEMMRYIFGLLPPSPVIIEAGAHNGLHTVWLSILSKGGVVHAFEPVPALNAQLTRNTYSRRNVRRYKMALSDTCGSADMFVSTGASDASSSLLSPKDHLTYIPSVTFEQSICVETITLDAWAKESGVREAHLLWLDMQGHELAALKAGAEILRSALVVHMEVSLVEMYEGTPLYPEVRAWMDSQGFHVACEDLLSNSGGDVVFVRSR